MFTFGTKPPSNMVDPTIDHIDNNRLNNRISNLQWLERRDNSLKATTNLKGNNNPRRTISENIAKAIIYDLQQGILNCKQIANKFNVTYDIVTSIKHGNSWTYLTKDLGFVTRFKSKTISDEMRLEMTNKKLTFESLSNVLTFDKDYIYLTFGSLGDVYISPNIQVISSYYPKLVHGNVDITDNVINNLIMNFASYWMCMPFTDINIKNFNKSYIINGKGITPCI